MSSIQTSLNVLIIDDEAGFVENLQNDANPHKILLTHATNLEDGQKLLQENSDKSFEGLILDRGCYFDSKMTDKGNILSSGIIFFREHYKNLPIVILTAHKELASSEQGRMYKVFSKDGKDIDAMFTHIKSESQKLIQRKLANQYPDIFEVIDSCFPSAYRNDVREDLIFVLLRVSSRNNPDIKPGMVALRRIIETIHISINEQNNNVLPDYILSRGTFNDKMNQLVSAGLLKRHDIIFDSFWSVYKISSEFDAHPNLEKTHPYIYKTCVNQTMGILIWFKNIKL